MSASSLIQRLWTPQVPPAGSEKVERLILEEIREENSFLTHLASYLGTSVLLVWINFYFSPTSLWAVFPVAGWGIGVVSHGFQALVGGRRRFESKRRLQALKDQEQVEAERVEPARRSDEVEALRESVLESAEVARTAMHTVSPAAAADVSRGESQALRMVSWLDEANRVLESRRQGQRARRREVATKLSDADYRRAERDLQTLLAKLDDEEVRLTRLKQLVEDRRSRLESFLLALESVKLAGPGRLALPAVSAPLSERVALLEEGQEEGTRAETRMAQEVELAQELQQSFLPDRAPEVPGLSVAHAYRPSNQVGGDFYDFYQVSKNELLVAVGDASGHGLDSSMVSSMTKSALYMQVSSGRDIDKIMPELNQMMCDTLGRRRIMTLLLLRLDVEQGRLSWVNAGQVYPLLLRGQEVIELELPGYPLGVRSGVAYPTRQRDLLAGDVIVLLTDGIVEARRRDGELYGWDRLGQLLLNASRRQPVDLVAAVLEGLGSYTAGTPLEDDVTVVVLRYDP